MGTRAWVYGTALALTLPVVAISGDGVLEISQACAEQTGCFPGDDGGFPVTITSPGSYKLTGPLSVTDGTGTAILLEAASVRLDLNGFIVSGNPQLGGHGIEAAIVFNLPPDPPRQGFITVRNGIVGGFTGSCVILG